MKEQQSSAPVDPYAVLGVPRQADEATIKRAYFHLVRQFPPEQAPEKFQEIRAAYDRIKSAEARLQTDLFLLQPPPAPRQRRRARYDLRIGAGSILALALELGLANVEVHEDFHEPRLPRTP